VPSHKLYTPLPLEGERLGEPACSRQGGVISRGYTLTLSLSLKGEGIYGWILISAQEKCISKC